MLFILFASVLIAGSYSEHSPDCYDKSFWECEKNSWPSSTPETPEELKKFCQSSLSHMQCVVERFDECAKNSDEEEPSYLNATRKQLRFLQSHCKEDSQIFQVISNNLKCVISTLDNSEHICYLAWRMLNKTRQEELVRLTGGSDDACVLQAFRLHCVVAKFKVNCGGDVRNAVSQIIEGTDIFHSKLDCPQLTFFEDAFAAEFARDTNGEDFPTRVYEAIKSKSQ